MDGIQMGENACDEAGTGLVRKQPGGDQKTARG